MHDHADIAARLVDFERLCRETGTPCTVQRRAILEAVLASDDHPTADQIYHDVSARQRGISRATVHRTLETLVRLGAVAKVCHLGRAVRYDGRLRPHHHLVCLRCDKIIDLVDERLDRLPLPDTSAHGFRTLDHRVELRGICKDCRG